MGGWGTSGNGGLLSIVSAAAYVSMNGPGPSDYVELGRDCQRAQRIQPRYPLRRRALFISSACIGDWSMFHVVFDTGCGGLHEALRQEEAIQESGPRH